VSLPLAWITGSVSRVSGGGAGVGMRDCVRVRDPDDGSRLMDRSIQEQSHLMSDRSGGLSRDVH